MQIEFRIFDYIPLDDFYAGICKIKYSKRLDHLQQWGLACHTTIVHDYEALEYFRRNVIDEDYEGIILRDPSGHWRASTSRKPDFVKYKARKTGDFYVTEEIEGSGKYQGLIGSLRLSDAMGRDIGLVGSGLSDLERSQWGKFLNKVVEVEYETIHDSKLIQPTFKHLREDKTLKDCDEI